MNRKKQVQCTIKRLSAKYKVFCEGLSKLFSSEVTIRKEVKTSTITYFLRKLFYKPLPHAFSDCHFNIKSNEENQNLYPNVNICFK